MTTLLITGGTVVSATGRTAADVLVDGEKIVAALPPGSTVLGHDLVDARLDVGGVGDVEAPGRARATERRRDPLRRREVHVGHHDRRPGDGEGLAQRGADAGAAAGDDRVLAGEALAPHERPFTCRASGSRARAGRGSAACARLR